MVGVLSTQAPEEPSLKQFIFKEVLGSNPDEKALFALLTNDKAEQAVLLCNHNPFPVDEQSWNGILSGSRLEALAQNDKYGNFRLFPPKEYADVKATLIYPCNERDISKYRHQQRYMVSETAEDYKNLVIPYLRENKASVEWVYQCLEHKAESDRLIFEDSDPQVGFMLFPDLKWDGLNIENLYVQALVHRRDITCIRDLTADHLPLLLSLRTKSLEAIRNKYGLTEHQIRAFVHYHPTFYHFHVHFVSTGYNAPGSHSGKAILLDDLIRNIQMTGDFYQKATMTFMIGNRDPLFPVFAKLYSDLNSVSGSS